jgi:carboxyl-terminal processing protease
MRSILGVLVLSVLLNGQASPDQKELDIRQLNLASFEKIWTTIRDKHWEKNPGGLDWEAIHAEFRPKLERASNSDEARALMREMLERLHQTHFAIFPAAVLEDVDIDAMGDGSLGMDVRVLEGEFPEGELVVTRLDPGSPAERAGVQPGWKILSVDGKELAPAIRKLKSDPAVHELTLEHAVAARLSGATGGNIRVRFLDGAGRERTLDIGLAAPRGQLTRFGNLPPMHVWVESKKMGDVEYVAFNMFLDLPRVMTGFGNAVADCAQCRGFIIDLRGNPGGIGGMAMGMAGWLVSAQDQRLGAMYLRDGTIKFVINPRLEAFTGPVAILVDGTSASTSEIFAGGLQDLGRARIFGTRTAAAALPSVIEKLPNGDGFQYAVANYISEGGKPLEGIGVTPDVEVKLTRQALLAGHDPVVSAALDWIQRAARESAK